MKKILLLLAFVPSLAFAVGGYFIHGVTAYNINALPSTGITIANTGCVNIKDAGGTAIGVLCLDASDDLNIGDATGVDNMNFDIATGGSYDFQINTGSVFSIGSLGQVAIVSTATTQDAMLITADALTSGEGLKVKSNSPDTGNRAIFEVINDHIDSTGTIVGWFQQDSTGNNLFLDTNGDAVSLNIDSEAASTVAITVDASFTALSLDTNAANTVAISTYANTAGDFQLFRTDATPEGSVTGSIGDLAVDGTGGVLYIKNTGSATNAGWESISTDNAYSSLWFHGVATEATITNQDTFTKITIFVNEGAEDPGGNVIGDATTDDDITINLAGTYDLDIQASFSNDGGGAIEIGIGVKVILATPKTITGATNATPVVITSVGHGLKSGDGVEQSNVGGNTAANGDFFVTRLTADTYSLQDLDHVNVAGGGAYTSGGTVDSLIPGDAYMERIVSNTQLGRGATHGTTVLAVGDIVEATMVNSAGTDNLSVRQIQMGVDRLGN